MFFFMAGINQQPEQSNYLADSEGDWLRKVKLTL